MKTFIMISILFFITALAFISCEDSVTNDLVDSEILLENVESVTVRSASLDGPSEFVQVSVQLTDEMLGRKLPDALFVLGTEGDEPLRPHPDDPLHFTGQIQHPELARSINDQTADGLAKGPKFSCKIEITSPGDKSEKCGGKECSETSMLGGKTWFCICIYECEVGWE